MTDQTSQGAELFKMVKKKRFSIPKIKLPGGGKIKYLLIAVAVVVLAYNLLFVYVESNEFGIKVCAWA